MPNKKKSLKRYKPYTNKHHTTIIVAAACIAAAAWIIPSYSSGGGDVHIHLTQGHLTARTSAPRKKQHLDRLVRFCMTH